jgi:hypothetical protein
MIRRIAHIPNAGEAIDLKVFALKQRRALPAAIL